MSLQLQAPDAGAFVTRIRDELFWIPWLQLSCADGETEERNHESYCKTSPSVAPLRRLQWGRWPCQVSIVLFINSPVLWGSQYFCWIASILHVCVTVSSIFSIIHPTSLKHSRFSMSFNFPALWLAKMVFLFDNDITAYCVGVCITLHEVDFCALMRTVIVSMCCWCWLGVFLTRGQKKFQTCNCHFWESAAFDPNWCCSTMDYLFFFYCAN